jgi:hypothetical protein
MYISAYIEPKYICIQIQAGNLLDIGDRHGDESCRTQNSWITSCRTQKRVTVVAVGV